MEKPIRGVPEMRMTKAGRVELRSLPDGESESSLIAGRAVPYGQQSEELWGFKEIIRPGAFGDTIAGDIRCLWNHESGKPLGRSSNGTLTLNDTPEGLNFECQLPNTTWGADARESIARGDVDSMSFGFITLEDNWTYLQDGDQLIREIIKAELIEISPVTFPAYSQTSTEARSALIEEGRKRADESREKSAKTVPLSLLQRRQKLLEKQGGF